VAENATIAGPTSARTFAIELSHAEEGVWTATSADIAGLNVEGDTIEQAMAEARAWAPELLRANGTVAEDESIELLFIREGERVASE
jgi:predicted RNase H-like HicB family nuclease